MKLKFKQKTVGSLYEEKTLRWIRCEIKSGKKLREYTDSYGKASDATKQLIRQNCFPEVNVRCNTDDANLIGFEIAEEVEPGTCQQFTNASSFVTLSYFTADRRLVLLCRVQESKVKRLQEYIAKCLAIEINQVLRVDDIELAHDPYVYLNESSQNFAEEDKLASTPDADKEEKLVANAGADEPLHYEVIESINVDLQTHCDLRDDYPHFPSKIYSQLPPFLSKLSALFDKPREKDLTLLAALALLSSCFPSYYGRYDRRVVAGNFMAMGSAPAASGKGTVNLIRGLGSKIQERLSTEYAKELYQYEKDLEEYTTGEQKDGLPPVKPKRKLFFVPANNTSSALTDVMKANKTFGVLFETEADTLVKSLKSEHGDFSDILRRASQHEPITQNRRKNEEYIEIDRSYLSMMLTGTPNQINRLLGNVENGLVSRISFYEFKERALWKNVFRETGEMPEVVIAELAEELDQHLAAMASDNAYLGTGSDDRRVQLTHPQQSFLNEYFANILETYQDEYGDGFTPSVTRMGLTIFRLAITLTAVREIGNGRSNSCTISCDTRDFETAFLIGDCCLKHAATVFKRISDSGGGTSKKQTEMQILYNSLPDSFNTQTLNQIARQLNINPKTTEYRVKKYIDAGKLRRLEYGYYSKVA